MERIKSSRWWCLCATIACLSAQSASEFDSRMAEAGDAFAAGDYKKSASLLKEVCGVTPLPKALTDAQLAGCLQARGTLEFLQCDIPGALSLYQRATALWEKILEQRQEQGPEARAVRQSLAVGIHNIGLAHKQLGHFGIAAGYLERALKMSEELHGRQDPRTAATLSHLGAVYLSAGRPEAEPALLEAASIQRALTPDGSEDLAATLCYTGKLRRVQGRYGDAVALLQQAETMGRKTLGPYHANYGDVVVQLAGAYREMGRIPEAEPWLRRAAAILAATPSPGAGRRVELLREQALVAIANGKVTTAEHLLLECIAIAKAAYGPDSLDVGVVENDLGMLYARRGRKLNEAERLLQHGLEMARRSLGGEHRNVAIGHQNLALVYDRMQLPARASHHHEIAIRLLSNIYGDSNPHTAQALSDYARFLKAHNQPNARQIEQRAKRARLSYRP